MKAVKRRLFVVNPPNTRDYAGDLLARALVACADRLGFRAWEVSTKLEVTGLTWEDVLLIMKPVVPPVYHGSLAKKIIFNIHPTCPGEEYSGVYRRNFRNLQQELATGRADAVFDYNEHTTNWMRKAGMNAIYCPVGYHELFEVPPVKGLKSRRDDGRTDAYLIGRADCGNRPEWVMANRSWAKVIDWREHQWLRPSLLSTDAVHLNVTTRVRCKTFLSMRVIMLLMANRRFVLSEIPDWSPLKSGEHWATVERKGLEGAYQAWAKNDKGRHEIAEAGYQFIRFHHRLDYHFEMAMKDAGVL